MTQPTVITAGLLNPENALLKGTRPVNTDMASANRATKSYLQ
ncbi:hypothetical protein PGH42_18420 [Legionella pneumophila]|nr:hypothetical protein PGH42_18420 [Legionella pneumophila]